jgi:hypothetical protein
VNSVEIVPYLNIKSKIVFENQPRLNNPLTLFGMLCSLIYSSDVGLDFLDKGIIFVNKVENTQMNLLFGFLHLCNASLAGMCIDTKMFSIK